MCVCRKQIKGVSPPSSIIDQSITEPHTGTEKPITAPPQGAANPASRSDTGLGWAESNSKHDGYIFIAQRAEPDPA